ATRTNWRWTGRLWRLRRAGEAGDRFLTAWGASDDPAGGGRGGPEGAGTGGGGRRGPFQEGPAAGGTDTRAPDPPEAARDDGDRDGAAPDDLLEAAVKRQQEAVARQAALGEDANGLAPGEGLAGGAERFDDGARPGGAVDGDDAAPAQQVAQAP